MLASGRSSVSGEQRCLAMWDFGGLAGRDEPRRACSSGSASPSAARDSGVAQAVTLLVRRVLALAGQSSGRLVPSLDDLWLVVEDHDGV